jgi:excisionase family DNA binding protein
MKISAPKRSTRISGESSTGLVERRFSKAKTIAERLGVCPRTIFRWADDGKLARHKISARVVLFDEAEVLALLQAAKVLSS